MAFLPIPETMQSMIHVILPSGS